MKRITNVAIVFTLLAAFVPRAASQSEPLSPATADEPFSSATESLNKTADTLLAKITTDTVAHQSVENLPSVSNETVVAQTREFARLYWQGHNADLTRAIQRVRELQPWIQPVLRSEGLPDELVSVVLVESAGRPDALSPRGARGLWQLVPETAQLYGLKVQPEQDDRLDVMKATTAAAQYLHELYTGFGDWRLALAAYNVGAAAVQRAIIKAGSRDFDVISRLKLLPLETRTYVPAVLAGMELLRGKSNATTTPQALETGNVVYAFSQSGARAGGD